MSFAERLKTLMEQRGYNQKSLAVACGFGDTAIRDLIKPPASKGKDPEPSVSKAYKIAEMLEVRVEDMLGLPYLNDAREYSMPDVETSFEIAALDDLPLSEQIDGTVSIPEYDIKLAAGGGYFVDREEKKASWRLPTLFIAHELRSGAQDLTVAEVTGDSMYPKLHHTDRIIINHSDVNPTPPGVFALWDGYGLVVKNVHRIHKAVPAKLLLVSENPIYPPYEVDAQDIVIVGRVVGRVSKM